MRFVFLLVAAFLSVSPTFAQRIEVTIPATAPLTGHLILVISKKSNPEPRMQLEETYTSAQGFGVDVTDLAPHHPIVIDDKTIGYPRRSLTDLDPGDYTVQAVFNVYEQFHLASGKTLWLPPDKGEGQHWNLKPGNLYSRPHWMQLDARLRNVNRLVLDQEIPSIPLPADTKYIKHIKIKSELLSRFWGRPMYLGANILLPEGFD